VRKAQLGAGRRAARGPDRAAIGLASVLLYEGARAATAPKGNSTMKKLVKPLLLVGLLAGASVTAIAVADDPSSPNPAAPGDQAGSRRGGHRGPHHSMAGRLSRHAQELGLTPQQLEAIKAAEEAARPEMDRLFQAVREQRQALESGQGNADQLKTARQALHARREALRTQVDSILTAEQRSELQQLREARRGKFGHRRPGGPPPPEGTPPAK
jgi:Spy/CpxP family protein refolding chaperone